MEIVPLLITVFVVSFSGALMPGPVMTLTITQAMKRGHLAGPLVSAGHGIAEGTLVLALSLGLGHIFKLPLVSGAIGVLGGLCLLYMAVGMIRAPVLEMLPAKAATEGRQMGPVAAGVLASIANPYWVLWWATIGANFLAQAYPHGALAVAAFFLVHFSVDLGWNSAVGSAVAAGRRLLTPKSYKAILTVCGVFLLLLGVYFLVSGADSLRHL